MSDWIILDRYPFSLLPGEARKVEGAAESYYEYLNGRWQETGKNVQCVAWLLGDFSIPLPTVEEPFGGCGVFATAIQHLLGPGVHTIMELDEECAKQLLHCVGNRPGVAVLNGDAHNLAGRAPADLYVCDFPYFTYTRVADRGEWLPELERMATNRPEAILITDGFASRYHLGAAALARRGLPVTQDRESYARLLGSFLHEKIGYSIDACAWHGTCFYFRAVRRPQGAVRMRNFPAGSGPAGLRPVKP